MSAHLRAPGAEGQRGPRLLLLSTSLDLGGAENVLHRLALGLRSRGCEIEAASLLPAGEVGRRLRADGFPLHDLSARSKLAAPLALARLARLLRRRRFDLVQSFLFHANLLARLARLAAPGTRLVASIRIIEARRPLRQRAERLTARLSDRIVCVSAAVRRAIDPAGDPRYLVIRNGVPIPPEPAPLRPGAPYVSIGRLHPQKGHDVLIDAWRALGAAAPRLAIAGAGPEAEALVARAAGLPVEFLGERADAAALLAGAGGFVLASREEGLPNALLEAMAAGLPVVATTAGGIPEAIESGREGLLVAPGDPRALAATVAALAADPARARSLGAAARARARAAFSAEAMVSAYDRLYQSLLAGRPAGSTI